MARAAKTDFSSDDLNLAVERVSTSSLRPSPRNARTHSRRQIRQIADSIVEFGFLNPILIDKNGEIIAGHGRVAAAVLLKMMTVPVVRIEHLTEAQKRLYVIADNRLAELAGWNREVLSIELADISILDSELRSGMPTHGHHAEIPRRDKTREYLKEWEFGWLGD